MALKLNSSGGGSVTLDAPVTANNYTLTAPASSGTLATTDGGNTTFTSITDSGNLTFTGTGNRITGDFSNATIANRVLFQTSATNTQTTVGIIPNGTSQSSALSLESDSASANGSTMQMVCNFAGSGVSSFISGIRGTGTYLPMTFYTGGSERMRIDTSGNVGIGTTPSYRLQSLLDSGSTAGIGYPLMIENRTTAAGNLNGTGLGFYYSYRASGAIETMRTNPLGDYGTALIFKNNAPSTSTGILGDLTERMRIDSSGNVGIGTSSPTTTLSIESVGGARKRALYVSSGTTAGSPGGIYCISNNAAGGNGAVGEFIGQRSDGNGATAFSGYIATAHLRTDARTTNGISLGGIRFGGNSTGTTSSDIYYSAQIVGMADGSWTSASAQPTAIAFYTGSTGVDINSSISECGSERMRIDSSGNLLVGATATGSYFDGIANFAGRIHTKASTTNYFWQTGTGVQTFVAFILGTATPTQVGSISTNGTTTAYNTTSDYRLKENIQPMQNALAVVQQLNPVTYTWKADGSDGQGFIAHELQAVVPDCVTGEKDAVDEEGNPVYQGIDTSFLVATLCKAIQEQQEQIEQLKSEVAALKGA